MPRSDDKKAHKDEKPLSRSGKMKSDGIEPEMPEADAIYLVGYLWEVGPVLSGGMSAIPVSFSELESWQRQTGICLQPWEVRLLRRLSFDYLSESHKAEEADCPPPWSPVEPEINREEVSRKVQNAMRAFIQSKKK